MKKLVNLGIVIMAILILPTISLAKTIGGPHLWLSTDPLMFNEGGVGYVGSDSDDWINDSYVTSDNPFELYIFNATKGGNAMTAYGVALLVTIHEGETGTVNVGGTDYSSFPGTTLPSEYGAGSHGVYTPSGDGRYAIAPVINSLDSQAYTSVTISYTGLLSQIHFDVISENGLFNPPSHDATTDCCDTPVPEPGTLILLGSGIMGLGIYRRRFKK